MKKRVLVKRLSLIVRKRIEKRKRVDRIRIVKIKRRKVSVPV